MNHIPQALIVTADEHWRDCCARILASEGCEIETASNGFQALATLHRHAFDIIAVDDSFSDLGPIELSLDVRDLAPNHPLLLIGGQGLSQFAQVWSHCNVLFTGPKDELPGKIATAVAEIRARRRVPGGGSRSRETTRS